MLAPRNTVLAICGDLEDMLGYCWRCGPPALKLGRADITKYIKDLEERPSTGRGRRKGSRIGLSKATISRRLSSVRGYYDYLIEEGLYKS